MKNTDPEYWRAHDWVKYHFGKPQRCEDCGLDKIPEGMKHYFDWANVSRNYLRERSDWRRLCKKCHSKLDHPYGKWGEEHHSAKLKEKQVRVIKWALHYGVPPYRVSKWFKVSDTLIRQIITGRCWKNVKILL